MLKLKRVEIQGFKSFFDRTEMKFNGSGIAAVVGPNGCGKSNLSDAISWVLGEQSAKSLRGARMEDVIFAGTRERKPLGMASVTMTLVDPRMHGEGPVEVVNADELPPVANGHENGHKNGQNGVNNDAKHAHLVTFSHAHNGEVTITRRLYRSGESEYLINGRPGRLRDIQDIFMGTGLGPESYAIIEQGRIGQILSNKPADRRSVIEEAAGITRFKTKKRLAEAKLEGAKQNLARVFDILEEVGRQCNSLKRQAAKAKRYEELRTDMVAHLRVALTGRFRMLEREAAKLALDLNQATQEFQTLSAQVTEKDSEQTRLLEHSYKTEAELTENRGRLGELKVDAERTRGRLDSQAKQISSIEQRLTQGETETQDIGKRLEQSRGELEVHVRNLGQLDQQTEAVRQSLAVKAEERDQIQQSLRERERAQESARQQVLRLLGETSTLKNQLAQIEEYLAAIQRDRSRSEHEAQAAEGERGRLDQVKAQLSERMAARQLELESVMDRRRGVEEELSVQKNRLVEARRKLEHLRAELARQKARRDSLNDIISHRSYTTESVKRLFKAVERGQVNNFQPVGVLADFVEVVDNRFERATEDFLHDELEYVVVKSWEHAEQGIDLMRSDVDGRATFLVEPPHSETAPAPAHALSGEGVIAPLREMLKFTNGLTNASTELLPRLERCYLAENRQAAQSLAVTHPDMIFLAPDGVSYQGHAVSGGKKLASGPLALKRELRELNTQVQARQREMDQTAALLESIEEEIARLTEELERLRGMQQAQEKDALALDHEFRKLNEEFNRATSRLSVARLELDRLAKEAARSEEHKRRNVEIVEQKDQLRLTQEQALEQARTQLGELQSKATVAAEEHSVLRAQLAQFEERRRAEQASRSRLENQIRDLSQRQQQLAFTLEKLVGDRTRLEQDNLTLDAKAKELAEQIAALEQVVAKLAEQEAAVRGELTASDDLLKTLRNDAQGWQERRTQFELELVKKQAELKYLDETARKELSASLEELAQGEETVLDDAALAEAEARYQEIRGRIDALGPVNADALAEHQEAQQRYDFLNAQRQDLIDSIKDTERAIQDLDQESRKRFGEAFEAINSNFKEMFTTLFGGGSAEMRLTDETNLAESGIDIVASPPGKKLQSVLLLSGGEKSLTAMALLMAIFRYQPSPFCVLDEVDAPLDEPNIMRLTRLIQEMAKQTQFVVITHAKRTMEAAQALYGVTMQEPGVSKLVSVRFEQPAGGDQPGLAPQTGRLQSIGR
ncbi:MAG: chromosome segregation protein SMC [Acidobacteria bacterium]|nr:chromosome segregation protein SMC [Acidobacteriota bacterium]